MWIKDPKTNEFSVSLTLVVVSVTCVLVVGFLEVFGKVKTVSIFNEFMYSSIILYFGRKMNIGGKIFTSEPAEEVKNKLENNK